VLNNQIGGAESAIACGRCPDLQGMRAVAVLAVVADHSFGWTSRGFFSAGVQTDLLANPSDRVLVNNWWYASATPGRYQRVWEAVTFFGDDRGDECGTPRSDALSRPDPLIAAAQAVPSAALIDLPQYYCEENRYPSFVGNVTIYRDHKDGLNPDVTAAFLGALAPAVENGLRRALSVPHSDRAVPESSRHMRLREIEQSSTKFYSASPHTATKPQR
jgi:hypothetical protein